MCRYDTRGHGSSSTPEGPYTVEQLGEDVVRLLDHLNISKAAFCGISMGGLTGQWLAIHYPDRFSHVIVANTAAKIGQEQAWLDRAKLVSEQGLQPIERQQLRDGLQIPLSKVMLQLSTTCVTT